MKVFYFFALLMTTLHAFGQNTVSNYKVYSTKSRQIISLDELVKEMDNCDVLFFGEEHNDSIGHLLEVTLFEKLNQRFPGRIAVSLEMFHTDTQPVVNEYLVGAISEKNFIKEARAWSNYKDYKPLIEYAKNNKLSVIAANAAARYSNAVTTEGLGILGKFPKTSAPFLPPLPIDTATGRYQEKFNEILGGHSMGTMKVYQTQNFWDATMAWSIVKFAKENKGIKILQVNGRFHSDEQLGTLAKLQGYAPKLRIKNISSFSDESFDSPNWQKFESLGDYIIITNPKIKRSY
jgi:uncharacterized iron-regulated protein